METLSDLIGEEHWQDDEVDARYQSAVVMIDQIGLLRDGSKTRGKWLRAAGVLQVLAGASLGLSTLGVLSTRY
ncbi:hypothetical protein [Mycobacterium sp. AZCC_0083]|uniref:hypothetical protein n=1 Tax=Mycobacterium sp. AZCC_0083 TaxID=2735882 RepID=UPI001610FB67|nr:hypothetical protein [Mycobacterium sp. AZCC_0083]MBB5166487.1 hypothetical protein [Mycobacterium sp. AZCC_0083]